MSSPNPQSGPAAHPGARPTLRHYPPVVRCGVIRPKADASWSVAACVARRPGHGANGAPFEVMMLDLAEFPRAWNLDSKKIHLGLLRGGECPPKMRAFGSYQDTWQRVGITSNNLAALLAWRRPPPHPCSWRPSCSRSAEDRRDESGPMSTLTSNDYTDSDGFGTGRLVGPTNPDQARTPETIGRIPYWINVHDGFR